MKLHSVLPGGMEILTKPCVSPQDSTEACVGRAGAEWSLLVEV